MNRTRIIFVIIIISALTLFSWLFLKNYSRDKAGSPTAGSSQDNKNILPEEKIDIGAPVISNNTGLNKYGFAEPLKRSAERVTKKKFGQYITLQNSPVQPERFQGYHTGVDFEIFPEEANTDVAVRAVCSGKLISKEIASGYGGVAIESCELEGNPITVVYGHLKLSSIALKNNSDLKAGDTLGFLGKEYSAETDGERKHLHLGFHKGSGTNIRGYVSSESQLSNWLDPYLYVCGE